MKNLVPLIIFLVVLLAVDLYAFKSLRLIASTWTNTLYKNTAVITYILSSLLGYGLLIYAFLNFSRSSMNKANYYVFFMGFALILLVFLPKLIVSAFHLFDDLIHLLRRVAGFFVKTTMPSGESEGVPITRWQFLSRIGWLVAAIPFFGIIYGVARGRWNFRIVEEVLKFPHLPAAADGLRIVHISDIHIGSFFEGHGSVMKGIEKINALKPDLILFTGDMVNNYANELEGWIPHLSKLEARLGKYSILGNHDYGDYVHWPSETAKRENLDTLKNYHREMGFKLMLNENLPIQFENGESFELIGIENWGLGGFSQYGKLDKALTGTDSSKFQILLSHDPSHWDAEVIGKTKIDLSLAGHTHGMQFGIEIPGLVKWSPVKYRYPRWGGLYTEGNQHLYVNRGFGYIGFPGRVGMPPEITLIELRQS
jgi:predicted MPP superfamily phosphohydrolase